MLVTQFFDLLVQQISFPGCTKMKSMQPEPNKPVPHAIQLNTATWLGSTSLLAPFQELRGSARKLQDVVEEGRDPLDVLGCSV